VQDIERLVDALTSALPTADELTQFAAHHFPDSTRELGSSNLRTAALDLVEWATAEGLFDRLVDALRSECPNNPDVRMLQAASLDPEPELIDLVARIPQGPRVPFERVDDRIIRAFAFAAPSRVRGHLFVLAANRLRRSVDSTASTIALHRIPGFDAVGASAFWLDVLDEACKHGPRMIGSLLAEHRLRLRRAESSVSELLDALTRGTYLADREVDHA